MRRLKINTFFFFGITLLFSITSIGYSALSQAITLSGDATYNSDLLYSVFEKSYNSSYVHEYTGSHQDSMAEIGSNKIYHWYADNNDDGTAITDKNNVIFANHCWQMIRTTDTGGVKMIYNGEAENNQCLNTRGTHVGYNLGTAQYKTLNSNYWYGTDYTYDNSTKNFQLAGATEQVTWSDSTYSELIKKYTCMKTTETDTCSTLYLVESYRNSTSANIIPLTTDSNYSQYGQIYFNRENNNLAEVGYMNNIKYSTAYKTMYNTETLINSTSVDTSYWYADSISYNSSTGKYSLVNPYKVSSTSDYPNLVGKYTFRNGTQNYTNTYVSYISSVNNSTMRYFSINSGNDLSYYNFIYGDSYTDNGNGTYTIDNPSSLHRKDWETNYEDIEHKFYCKYTTSNTCSEIYYAINTNSTNISYTDGTANFKYSKNFTYDGTKYILDDNTALRSLDISSNYNYYTPINNAHYTCWNTSGECTTLSYINYIKGGTKVYYIDLTDGKSINDAINEMLHDDNMNQNNSTIKFGIDAWYKKYLLSYDSYIEDTIFCNDRTVSELAGWNPDGGDVTKHIKFNNYENSFYAYINSDLSCTNTTDKFSVSNNKAKLTHKVGLMSLTEMNLSNNKYTRKTGQMYWLNTPRYYWIDTNTPSIIAMGIDGGFSDSKSTTARGLRLAISLKLGVRYSSGDGSMANPYVVDAPPTIYDFYAINQNSVSIGTPVASLGTTYTSPTDAASNFSKTVFLKYHIQNNNVASSSVVFMKDGNSYDLQGGGATYNTNTNRYNSDSIYYNSNSQKLIQAFGSSNCNVENGTEIYDYTACYLPNINAYADSSGYVGASGTDWNCVSNAEGVSDCATGAITSWED